MKNWDFDPHATSKVEKSFIAILMKQKTWINVEVLPCQEYASKTLRPLITAKYNTLSIMQSWSQTQQFQ